MSSVPDTLLHTPQKKPISQPDGLEIFQKVSPTGGDLEGAYTASESEEKVKSLIFIGGIM